MQQRQFLSISSRVAGKMSRTVRCLLHFGRKKVKVALMVLVCLFSSVDQYQDEASECFDSTLFPDSVDYC